MKHPPAHLKKILWEYDTDALIKKSSIVLERVLLFGNKEDIEYVGLPNLKAYFKNQKPHLDDKSQNFWSIIFNMSSPS